RDKIRSETTRAEKWRRRGEGRERGGGAWRKEEGCVFRIECRNFRRLVIHSATRSGWFHCCLCSKKWRPKNRRTALSPIVRQERCCGCVHSKMGSQQFPGLAGKKVRTFLVKGRRGEEGGVAHAGVLWDRSFASFIHC
ncbi:unnamed protein product, partial [Ectocarpus sp. 6 AP-2014]